MGRRERQARRVLGVDEHASAGEITRAYRALARRLHPDVAGAGADPGRFAEVARAYAVLAADAPAAPDDPPAAAERSPRRPGAVRIPVRHVRPPPG